MIKNIIEAISAIGDGLIAIIDYLGARLLEGLKMWSYMFDAVGRIEQYISWAPVGIASIIGSIVTIAVLYRILGWGD